MPRPRLLVALATAALLTTAFIVDPPSATATVGPPATSIEHAADGTSTRVLVHGIGTATAAAGNEGRRFTHSDLQPAGRFVADGEQVVVTVPADAPAMEVAIGLIGTYSAHNAGRDVGYHRTALSAGRNVVTAPHDGMVSLVSIADGGQATATVSGGEAVPVFVRGASTNASFAQQMQRYADAPFVEVVADRMFGDFQKPRTGSIIAADDLEARTANWDRVVELTNETYGLVDGAVGTSRKHAHRIHIVSPDSGAGYANASNARIMFQVGTAAAGDLFRAAPAAQWALWHEIGHTYESSINSFPGTAETITNLSALAVQERLGFGSRWDESISAFEAYFASEDRNWVTAHDRIRLLAWEQLRRAFGDHFLPRFFQALRTEAALTNVTVVTNDEKHALFVRTASRIADRDLTPFYDALGFPMSDETRAAIGEYPDLEQRIWDNVDSTKRITERIIPAYDPPIGTVTGALPDVPVGRWDLAAPTVTGLGTVSGTSSARVVGAVGSAEAVGADAAKLAVRLQSANGTEDAIVLRADAVGGNSIVARGQSNRVVGTLSVDAAADRLRWHPFTSYGAHSSYADKEYLAIVLLDSDGEQVTTGTVRGNQNGSALNAAFGAHAYRDGQFLLVSHQQPTLLAAYRDGVEVQDGGLPQAFRIQDGRLEPVDREAIPGWQSVRPGTSAEVPLVRGADTAVPAALEVHARITKIRGTVTFSAPAGTTFAAGQTTLAGFYSAPGVDWTGSANLVLRNGTRSADGGTLSYTLATGGGFQLSPGASVRWSPVVSTPDGAQAGSGQLGILAEGTTE